MSRCEWEAACHHGSTCALTGASAFFDSIPGSFTLVNGPLWCYFYAMKYVDNENPMAQERFACTQVGPNSLVYGTEADLRAGFDFILKTAHPERVFIESNCSVSLVGDDVQGIADEMNLPWLVYAADGGGLKGSFEGGYSAAFLRVAAEMKPAETLPGSVNVLGLSTVHKKGREDAAEIRRLLEMAGISVISMPGVGSSWDDIMRAPSAALNVVVRDELGLAAARQMEREFGISYISVGLPYGTEGTLSWLRRILETLGAGSLGAVSEEARKLSSYLLRKGNNLESLWGSLWFDEIFISAPPSDAIGIAEAVRGEWADTAKMILHLQAASEKITPAADKIRVVLRDDAAMKEDYENWTGGLVLSSSHETRHLSRLGKRYAAFHIALPSPDEVSFTDLPQCGLRGAAYLYENLWNAKLREKTKA